MDMCAGTQSQADSNMRLGGCTTVSLDIRKKIEAFGAEVVNLVMRQLARMRSMLVLPPSFTPGGWL